MRSESTSCPGEKFLALASGARSPRSASFLRSAQKVGLGLWTLLFFFSVGCVGQVEEAPPKPRRVVFFLLDTLRADHLSLYGYSRPTSPFLEELAEHGVVFEDTVSAAPATFPSVNSLFTSRQPNSFYQTNARDFGIPEELDTLAEVFLAEGFRTGAVSASPVVRRSPSFFNPDGGFGQGFQEFDETCGYKERHVPPFTAPCVTEKALGLIDQFGDDPFFLYVHYLDPHDPYQPPAESNPFLKPYDGPDFIQEGRTYPLTLSLLGQGDPVEVTARDIQQYIDLYDGEIRAVDGEIRKVYEAIESRGMAEDTLFVFVSDHGESFLEHEGILQHGRSVFQTELHVVLMFHWKEMWSQGTRRSEPVCSIDIMPTLLQLTGLPIPETVQGRPLISSRGGRTGQATPCFATGRPNWRAQNANLLALRAGDEKIVLQRDIGKYSLYNLGNDPLEQNDLAPEDPQQGDAKFQALRQVLESWGRRQGIEGDGQQGDVELDGEAEKALKALGYIN